MDINGVLCPPEFNGGNPGTILPIGQGTPYQVVRYDPTGKNIQDSTGSDNPANGPTQWPAGLNVVGNAGYLQKTVGTGGILANQLVDYDSSGNAIISAAASQAVHGVANFTASAGGSIPIAIWGSHNVLVDNQTVINDHACPSSTPGEATDTGSAAVPTSCQDLGTFQSVNAGAGTLAVLEMPSPVSLTSTIAQASCLSPFANAYFINPGSKISCDSSVTDDGVGNMTMKSLGLTDATKAGFYYLKQGTLPPATPANTRMDTLPTAVTAHTVKHPGTAGAVGQAEVVSSTTTDTNGNTIDVMAWGTASGGAELQTNSVDNANCSGGVCPLLNFTTSPMITPSNPSGGIEQFNLDGFAQIATPTAPTLTVNGTPGSTQVCYKIVGWEDGAGAGAKHTAASTATCTSTANATLSSSNSITLTAYGDTLYGPRCYAVYRTTAAGTPSTTGLIDGCVGKKFTDSGLTADGSTAPSTNNTYLYNVCLGSSLPGNPSVPGAPCGVDGPPLSPTIYDDEFTENPTAGGAPADTNNVQWTWGNQGAATAAYSNGAIIITTDTTTSANYLTYMTNLPGTPYTFEVFIDNQTLNPSTTNGQQCFIGFRESGTSKITILAVYRRDADSVVAGAGGTLWAVHNMTSNTITAATAYQTYKSDAAYFKIQNDGTNIKYSTSAPGDGVAFNQLYTQTQVTPFTTTPNQLIIGGVGADGAAAKCMFDFERRTQ